MKLETSPKVTKSKRSLHWCRRLAVSVNKYLCRIYYSISQKVITLSGRRFITVSGVLLHYRVVITLSGVFYYIIGQLLQYRAFITLSVGTAFHRFQQSTLLFFSDFPQNCLPHQHVFSSWITWTRLKLIGAHVQGRNTSGIHLPRWKVTAPGETSLHSSLHSTKSWVGYCRITYLNSTKLSFALLDDICYSWCNLLLGITQITQPNLLGKIYKVTLWI